MIALGFESSCDETSVAVLEDDRTLANLVSSQDFHKKYGGVVPELSSRAHLARVAPLTRDALVQAGVELADVDLIAATAGPGLIGALLVGFTFAKGLAVAERKPFVPVNHVEAHFFSGFLMDEKPEYPFLALAVSGGHTMLVLVEDELTLTRLGGTVDDAAGEAFDKGAKTLGLPYPGGPNIQKTAERGDPERYPFPIAELKSKYDFSFSGVKTALLRQVQILRTGNDPLAEETVADLAASYQRSIVEALIRKTDAAIAEFAPKSVSLVGGVAANKPLREAFTRTTAARGAKAVVPSIQYCGDNAAMIAWRGLALHRAGERFSNEYRPFPSFQSRYARDYSDNPR
ncbi:MAG: tRNA (adenosine(37)-N6)-threonylcarbamoyltransferase complex transferase subunit TsaD [Ignavibacteriales bacterium]|nr:tRNA (adenosine(37)-N6)-threonylcarbamoyltransferase complex transferase subunit TsaD [Ignavibacteriales bacterium]